MIELKNVGMWQKSIGAISTFISEGNFRFSDSGVSFRATDPSQVVMVDFSVSKDAFDKYELEPTFVGIDLVELNKIVSRTLPSDKMLMNLNDSEMQIRLEGDLCRAFRLPLIDVSEVDVKPPKTSFDATVEISACILKEALKDALLFGSSVVFRVNDGQFLIEARGPQGTLKTVAKQTKHVTVKSSAEVVSKYSLNFLQNIVREANPEQKIVLELKSDAPMKVSYKIEAAQMQFHLAHMIL